jgi:membrane fusion protein (multidrug efflux system)
MKRAEWWIGGAALALALAGAGCGGSAESENPPARSAAAPTAKPAPPAAQTGGDSQGILSVLSVEHEVDVLAQQDGVVMEILRDEGSPVRVGEVLGSLDDRTLQAQSAKARADLKVAQDNVKYIEAQLKSKQAAYRRQLELRKFGLSSDADLEAAEFQAKGSEFDLESMRAVVERNQAEINLTRLELEKMRIRAPFSGVVERRYIRQGQNVVKADKCFRVSQLSPLRVQFQVPETSGRKPRVGEEVSLTLASDTHRVYVARIAKISPTVDAASGSYDLTAQLTGPDLSSLRPGMAVRVVWTEAAANPKP